LKIPLTITIAKNQSSDVDLVFFFGRGEKVPSELLKGIKEMEDKELHYVNDSAVITDGITLIPKKRLSQSQESYIPPESFVNLEYYLDIASKVIAITSGGSTIADWFWDKIGNRFPEITLFGKKLKTKEEFQKTLDEYFEKLN